MSLSIVLALGSIVALYYSKPSHRRSASQRPDRLGHPRQRAIDPALLQSVADDSDLPPPPPPPSSPATQRRAEEAAARSYPDP